MSARRMVGVDEETWCALVELAQLGGENVSAVARDLLRATLRRRGFTFTETPRRYNQRGMGRRSG
jgi:hypothetical protein